jgi:hypothetical protein
MPGVFRHVPLHGNHSEWGFRAVPLSVWLRFVTVLAERVGKRSGLGLGLRSGRDRDRTDDLYRVKVAQGCLSY